jgi:hypothetical protein
VSRLLTALLLFALTPAGGQSPQPLPERTAIFKATQANLERAQREQGRYAYKERRTELHTNPFGRIGTDGVRLYQVTPTSQPGVTYRTLLEKDGVKVVDARPERDEDRPRSDAKRPFDDVVDSLNFVVDRREIREGRETVVVNFAPKPDAQPQTREGRLAKLFTGRVWVDEAAHEVVHVEGTAIDSMSFGFGMIARLNQGTRVTLTRQPVDGSLWLPTAVRFNGEGRALLFRKLNIDFAVDWFDYKEVLKTVAPSAR